jgi:hypothetical protein
VIPGSVLSSVTLVTMAAQSHDRLAEKLRLTLDLYEAGEDMVRAKLRRQHPDASAEEIEAMIERWLMERPGAELGDALGHPRPWPPPHR